MGFGCAARALTPRNLALLPCETDTYLLADGCAIRSVLPSLLMALWPGDPISFKFLILTLCVFFLPAEHFPAKGRLWREERSCLLRTHHRRQSRAFTPLFSATYSARTTT